MKDYTIPMTRNNATKLLGAVLSFGKPITHKLATGEKLSKQFSTITVYKEQPKTNNPNYYDCEPGDCEGFGLKVKRKGFKKEEVLFFDEADSIANEFIEMIGEEKTMEMALESLLK